MKRDYIASDELITLNRKTRSKAYWCEQYQLSEQDFDRLYYTGKSPRQIFGLKKKPSKQNLYTIDGETKNFGQWCDTYGLKTNTVRHRMKRGMSLIEALTAKKHGNKRSGKLEKNSRFYTFNGKTKNVSQWCDYYGISRTTFYRRLKKGMDAIEAFKIPASDVL